MKIAPVANPKLREAAATFLIAANRDARKGELGLIPRLQNKVIAGTIGEFKTPAQKANAQYFLLKKEQGFLRLLNIAFHNELRAEQAVVGMFNLLSELKNLDLPATCGANRATPVEIEGGAAYPFLYFAIISKMGSATIDAINDFISYALPEKSDLVIRKGKDARMCEWPIFVYDRKNGASSKIGGLQVFRERGKNPDELKNLPWSTQISYDNGEAVIRAAFAFECRVKYSQSAFASSGAAPLESWNAMLSLGGIEDCAFRSKLSCAGFSGLENHDAYSFHLRKNYNPVPRFEAEILLNSRIVKDEPKNIVFVENMENFVKEIEAAAEAKYGKFEKTGRWLRMNEIPVEEACWMAKNDGSFRLIHSKTEGAMKAEMF
ncbi:MAG: hypothetical protein WCT52_05580 [Candidatus Micrarchaeia archaeon]